MGEAEKILGRRSEEIDLMNSFQDKVAIVTGGASGIGRALCEELGRRGAVVVAADVHAKEAAGVAAAISAAGGRACPAALDVSRAEDVRSLVHQTAAEHGRLDYMFNNAGVALVGEVRHMNDEQWQRILDINLLGVMHGTLAAYSLMVEQGSGHIVNTASHAGLHPMPGTTFYAVAKHAVVGLSTSLRTEGAALGVKVTVVCPGPVRTAIFAQAEVVKVRRDFFSRMPSFMMAEPAEAAKVILEGVARNRLIIVFPFHARLLWWLNRIDPGILDFFGRQGFSALRKFGSES
jgi:NAD(P)-dependent dehydrogenase (short-subunit alcohol dehydrogenase family)